MPNRAPTSSPQEAEAQDAPSAGAALAGPHRRLAQQQRLLVTAALSHLRRARELAPTQLQAQGEGAARGEGGAGAVVLSVGPQQAAR